MAQFGEQLGVVFAHFFRRVAGFHDGFEKLGDSLFIGHGLEALWALPPGGGRQAFP